MDLPSDSDESDVDFVPEEKPCSEEEQGSGSGEEEEEEEDGESGEKGKKRSGKKKNGKRKKLKKDESTNDSNEPKKDPESDKKHADDLWASFLKPAESSAPKKCDDNDDDDASNKSNNLDTSSNSAKSDSDVGKKTKEIPANESIQRAPQVPIRKRPAFGTGGGLSSVLNKIGKNNKLSTLEKSKLDWNSFKKDEGIEEEIQTHNRGRAGYLERQDFLQRTDLRQFEIEKSLRASKRGNR